MSVEEKPELQRKNFKGLFIYLNGRTGCSQLESLQIAQCGH